MDERNASIEPVLADDDRAIWSTWVETAATHARTRSHARRIDAARRVLDGVLTNTPDAAVSWSGGKDSTVMTHLACVLHGAPWKVYSEKDDLDFPGEREYVESLSRAWGLDIEILTPPFSCAQWIADHAAEMHVGEDIHARAARLSKAAFYPLIEASNARHDCTLLGLRTEESAIRRHVRISKGLHYRLANGRWRALPIADWPAIDVYAYAVSHGIDLLPVYRCVGFMHREKPWMIRKSWWLPGSSASYGQIAWLRRYWPSLYRTLCGWFPRATMFG